MWFSFWSVAIGTLLSLAVNAASPPNQASLLSCLKSNNVPYADSTSANWTDLITPYNRRLQYTPAVVTLPITEQDVSSSVTCAAATGFKVQPKGGGHSYASYSSGGQDGSVVVDMVNFDHISVNNISYVIQIGSGQRLGNVAQGIYNYLPDHRRALPHGTCAGVGIAGHATHGGYGYASRKWGLSLDRIIALDVVIADGTIAHINSVNYSDVYYAMRGAGDSFGIVTKFYMTTEPAPSEVIYFTADLSAALNDINVATQAFIDLQDFVLNSPLLTPNITFGIYTDSGGSLSISGWCLECDLDNFQTTVLPAMLKGYSYSNPTIASQDWITALATLAAPLALTQPLGSAYKEFDTFYAKSLVTKNAHPLTRSAIRSFWNYIIQNQSSTYSFYSIINLYGGPGSAINTPSSNFSAYSDRDALWVFQNYGYTANNLPPFDPNLFAIVDGLNDAITIEQPHGNFSMYINYVDPNLSAIAAAEEYYGASTYDRLLGIKSVRDPNATFWNPQTVGNSVAL